ncbi:hypothetical protein ES703_79199 [subsurface metagenome]
MGIGCIELSCFLHLCGFFEHLESLVFIGCLRFNFGLNILLFDPEIFHSNGHNDTEHKSPDMGPMGNTATTQGIDGVHDFGVEEFQRKPQGQHQPCRRFKSSPNEKERKENIEKFNFRLPVPDQKSPPDQIKGRVHRSSPDILDEGAGQIEKK